MDRGNSPLHDGDAPSWFVVERVGCLAQEIDHARHHLVAWTPWVHYMEDCERNDLGVQRIERASSWRAVFGGIVVASLHLETTDLIHTSDGSCWNFRFFDPRTSLKGAPPRDVERGLLVVVGGAEVAWVMSWALMWFALVVMRRRKGPYLRDWTIAYLTFAVVAAAAVEGASLDRHSVNAIPTLPGTCQTHLESHEG